MDPAEIPTHAANSATVARYNYKKLLQSVFSLDKQFITNHSMLYKTAQKSCNIEKSLWFFRRIFLSQLLPVFVFCLLKLFFVCLSGIFFNLSDRFLRHLCFVCTVWACMHAWVDRFMKRDLWPVQKKYL